MSIQPNPEEHKDFDPSKVFLPENDYNSLLVELLPSLIELQDSIKDIPAQLELLSRVLLAKSFVRFNGQNYEFNKEKFERIWSILTENDQKTE